MDLVAYIFALILPIQTPKEEFRIIPAPIPYVIEKPLAEEEFSAYPEVTVVKGQPPVIISEEEPQGTIMPPNGCHVAEHLPPEKCQ